MLIVKSALRNIQSKLQLVTPVAQNFAKKKSKKEDDREEKGTSSNTHIVEEVESNNDYNNSR